ncbi:hypothetical protein F2P56_023199 [Juglans regia]|uniref:Leucine-rich repeat-containing N-terminal plant-type domain-containing protein n=2 Tax=Juglans regia TaxID=51240 RepID=A0A833U9N5_JUGRE|nr:receptor-like protein 7 [Juglans regia]KAF5459227.1 hypothetical protein F2P56_023199 [Juglans regia]
MPTCFRFLFSDLLVLFLLLLTASLSSPQPLCHQDESLALMQFMDSFIIYNDISCPTPWRVEAEHGRSDCCSWDGVECDPHTAHVIGLDLSDSCLYGSINSNSSLFRLSHLLSLNLAFNHFNYSKIPSTIGNLSRLTYLNLTQSFVSGEVPSEVSNLSKLSSLDLSYNYDLFYIGSLTRLVQNLTYLEEILLSGVNISSRVPESLANFSSLRTLRLGSCGLYGEFPIRIFQLPQLRVLRIAYNEDLTGQLPEFHSSNGLQALSLSYTSFFGSIPNSLWNLTQLTVLYLSRNSFDDLSCLTKANSNHTFPRLQYLGLSSLNLTKFPDFLQNQNKLVQLNLSDNNIQGIIPKWMYNASKENLQDLYLFNNFLTGFENPRDVLPWPNLRVLDLHNNRLQGSLPISQIPPSIQHLDLSNNFFTGFENSRDVYPWPNLLMLDLENNSLQGSLPIPPPYVRYYQVNKNAFTGEISPLFCNLSSLYVLDFSYNNLSGKLHPCFRNLSQSLIVFELQSNNIGGTIPDAWAKGCSLRLIHLNHNQLQGRLPRSLANCKELEYLDVGYNKIHDTFPLWLGTLPELKIFILRTNGFYGAIRNIQINCTLSNLHIIDLSHNNFSGDLPAECFQRWNTMKLFGAKKLQYVMDDYVGILYSISLTAKGTELEFERIQDELIVIDLSCNKFEGEIPEVVGSLKGLHILNFSNNALSGHIPSSLANLTSLESLDLSQNKLFGEIPPQLAQLTFLEIFKVFNNCLTDPIPHGSQFERFPNSSFDGNPGLCGSPLSKACGDSLPKPPNEGNQDLVSPFEFGWKVVAIGYGCGFVIGIVIGQWVIARKQDWFVNIFRIKK